ncbi:MAG: glycoside hydrolase family 10 protein [Cyanobacteria bacterium P01_H01_bin.15]
MASFSFPNLWQKLKKTLWLAFIFGLLSCLLIGFLTSAIANANSTQIRGVWLTSNDQVRFSDQGRTQAAIDQLAQLNFNTLYPVIWNSGYIMYESAVAQREGIQPFVPRGDQGQDFIGDIIAKAHQRRLMVMPWFEFGFMTPTYSELAANHPSWLTQRQDGTRTFNNAAGEVVWLNPFRPEVQNFITDLVLEIVNRYDLDGIQFDDHTALPNEFGYDPYTVALYQEETGEMPPSDPKEPAWVRWRADKITAFMAQLTQKIKAVKPNLIISLSPATYNLAYNTYLQDWLGWIREGIVDEVIVQLYRSSLSSFVEPINRAEIEEAQGQIPTAVGILTGLKTKPVSISLIADKVRVAQSEGVGISFFYYKTLWDVAPEDKSNRIQAFRQFFPRPAFRR